MHYRLLFSSPQAPKSNILLKKPKIKKRKETIVHNFWSLVNGKVYHFMNSLKKAINTNILLRKIRYSPFFILQTCVFSFHSEYKSNTIPAMGVHWAVTPLHRNIFPWRVTSFITILIFVSFQTHCLLIFIFIHIGGIGGSHFSF